MADIAILHVVSPDDLDETRALFREYADSLSFDLAFQGFEQELGDLPGRYAPPSGRLLLARADGRTAGCIALREIAPGVSEMKRLFVRAAFHGHGIGRQLCSVVLNEAREAGYGIMRLDTAPTMSAAITLYRSLGFADIAPYTENPIVGARFMELRLG